MNVAGKTVFITGASRGIGKAIALKLASGGANIIVAAKSVEENSKLGGPSIPLQRKLKLRVEKRWPSPAISGLKSRSSKQ